MLQSQSPLRTHTMQSSPQESLRPSVPAADHFYEESLHAGFDRAYPPTSPLTPEQLRPVDAYRKNAGVRRRESQLLMQSTAPQRSRQSHLQELNASASSTRRGGEKVVPYETTFSSRMLPSPPRKSSNSIDEAPSLRPSARHVASYPSRQQRSEDALRERALLRERWEETPRGGDRERDRAEAVTEYESIAFSSDYIPRPLGAGASEGGGGESSTKVIRIPPRGGSPPAPIIPEGRAVTIDASVDGELSERVSYLEYVLEETCRESKDSLKRAHQSIQNLTKALQEKEDELGRVFREDKIIDDHKEIFEARKRLSVLECEKIDRVAELNHANEELQSNESRLSILEQQKAELENKVNYLTIKEETFGKCEDVAQKVEKANAQSRAAWESAAGWRARSQAIEEDKMRLQETIIEKGKSAAEAELKLIKLEDDRMKLRTNLELRQKEIKVAKSKAEALEGTRKDILQAVDLVEAYVSSGDPRVLDQIFYRS